MIAYNDNSEKKAPHRPKDVELIARRETEILDEAARTFAQDGYRNADVQVIADRIGVGKGTVYRYFPTKQDLFLGAVDRVMRMLEERMHERVDKKISDSIQRIRAGIREYLAFFDDYPEFIELLMLERAEFKTREKPTYFRYQEESLKQWRATIEELMDAGRVRRMPVSRVVDVVSDLLYGAIFTNLFSGRKKSFEEQATDITDIVFNGFLSDQERVQDE